MPPGPRIRFCNPLLMKLHSTTTLDRSAGRMGDGAAAPFAPCCGGAAPGHTPGHQVLVVRLPKTGPVMLSGDMVHLQYSWANRVVPSFNFDVEQSRRTIDAMKDYTARTGTQLWINHDMEQHARIPKSPAFVE